MVKPTHIVIVCFHIQQTCALSSLYYTLQPLLSLLLPSILITCSTAMWLLSILNIISSQHYINAPKLKPVLPSGAKITASTGLKICSGTLLTLRSDQRAFSQPSHQSNFLYQGDAIHRFYASYYKNQEKTRMFWRRPEGGIGSVLNSPTPPYRGSSGNQSWVLPFHFYNLVCYEDLIWKYEVKM